MSEEIYECAVCHRKISWSEAYKCSLCGKITCNSFVSVRKTGLQGNAVTENRKIGLTNRKKDHRKRGFEL